jgi:hypothetical protein
MLGVFAQISGRLIYSVQRTIGRALRGTMRSRSLAAPIAFGVFNAFLPCHLIYAFAARAAGTGSVSEGALTMMSFGLGTVPSMVVVGVARRWLPAAAAASLSRVSGVLVIGFALLTLSRALGYGATCAGHTDEHEGEVMDVAADTKSEGSWPLVGLVPKDGIWTAVGMTRGQFLGVIAVSTALFVLIDGPVWQHLRDSHLSRILWSYMMIPPAVAGFLYLNGRTRLGLLVAATVVIGLVKLVLTAVILVLIGLAQA